MRDFLSNSAASLEASPVQLNTNNKYKGDTRKLFVENEGNVYPRTALTPSTVCFRPCVLGNKYSC